MKEARKSGYFDLIVSIVYVGLLVGLNFTKTLVVDKVVLFILSGLSIVIAIVLLFSLLYSIWGIRLGSNEDAWDEYAESERKSTVRAAKVHLIKTGQELPAYLTEEERE